MRVYLSQYVLCCPDPHSYNLSMDSYMIMLQCWEPVPERRPSFHELHTNTSKYTEQIAGYLEIGFNPFASQGATSVGVPTVERERVVERKKLSQWSVSTSHQLLLRRLIDSRTTY